MSKTAKTIIGILSAVVMLFIITYITPGGRASINHYFFNVQKADDATSYETLKKVEDTCRAMISSYETDKLTYEQYKGSDKEDEQSWAQQAKMRANKTVNTYNEYILKNSFKWEGNVPADIKGRLEIIN